MNRTYTVAIEDYLKAIYTLQHRHRQVTTSGLARWLGVAPASVTGMIKKLASHKLVIHRPYRGVRLSPRGRKVAVRILGYNRLVQRYLVEKLDVPREQARHHAENWEHVLSAALADRMAAALGEEL